MMIKFGKRHFAALAAAVLALTACSDRPPTSVHGESRELLGSLRLNYRALTIALGDSVQLLGTAQTIGGDTIRDTSTIRYKSESPNRVYVSETGMLSARDLTDQPIQVIAAISREKITRQDTILVFVTRTQAVPVSFAMKLDGDSARVGVGSSTDLLGEVITASGDTLTDVIVRYTAAKPNVARIYSYRGYSAVTGVSLGKAMVYGSTTIYGKTFTDSVQVTVLSPVVAYFGWSQGKWTNVAPVIIQAGGTISWYNWDSSPSTEITFSDPSAASGEFAGSPGGNIPPIAGARITRRFNTPGTYVWTSGSQSAKIIVTAPAAQ